MSEEFTEMLSEYSMYVVRRANTGGEENHEKYLASRDSIIAYVEQLESALAAERERNRWIPVSEHLPEKDTTEQWEMYLCRLNRYGEILVAPLCFIGGSWLTSSGSYGSRYDEYVTDWMPLPLPKPPKEDEE